jgi:ribosome biogenesis GTPase / thiamine phosphate phosphatase
MLATVYKSTGSWYVLKDESGRTWNGRLKGIFKIDGLSSTNPIAVGDKVHFEIENEAESTVTIISIEERSNYVIRQSPANKRNHHIVAANLDQSLLFATLREPRTSTGFIDRFLITCEAYHIPAIIVFNKADLYRKKEQERYEEIKEIYEAVGYRVFQTSLTQPGGLETLQSLLQNKTTLISGHSGVGKSTFINRLFPDLDLRTQEVSGWSGKGLHTTTFAEMFDLPFGGRIIDTPGVREFGLVDISKQELSHYYPEMKKLIEGCHFNNCLHVNEPGCAIHEAVRNGDVSEDRYVSYRSILDTIEERTY